MNDGFALVGDLDSVCLANSGVEANLSATVSERCSVEPQNI